MAAVQFGAIGPSGLGALHGTKCPLLMVFKNTCGTSMPQGSQFLEKLKVLRTATTNLLNIVAPRHMPKEISLVSRGG
jgi:hypothetical protein